MQIETRAEINLELISIGINFIQLYFANKIISVKLTVIKLSATKSIANTYG